MLRKNPNGKMWDFETSDYYIYQRFRTILDILDIAVTNEMAIPYEFCACKFCGTKDERIRIEYILRRLLRLDHRYLLDIDSYQDRRIRWEDEKYAIY